MAYLSIKSAMGCQTKNISVFGMSQNLSLLAKNINAAHPIISKFHVTKVDKGKHEGSMSRISRDPIWPRILFISIMTSTLFSPAEKSYQFHRVE